MDMKFFVHYHYVLYLIQDIIANILNNVDDDMLTNKIHLKVFLDNNYQQNK